MHDNKFIIFSGELFLETVDISLFMDEWVFMRFDILYCTE